MFNENNLRASKASNIALVTTSARRLATKLNHHKRVNITRCSLYNVRPFKTHDCSRNRQNYRYHFSTSHTEPSQLHCSEYIQHKKLMRYPNLTQLYVVTPLAFNAPDGGVPWDDLRKILHGSPRMAKVQNGGEILPKVSTP